MIILGIDPGTAATGYGLVKKTKKGLRYLDCGVIKTSAELPAQERLRRLNNQLTSLLKIAKPDLMAVESVFFFKNLKTAMPVSEARGVILLAAAKKKIPVKQLTPLQIKMAVCGYGRADKKQLQKMLKEILKLKEIPRPDDAADALGAAICCAQNKV